MSHQQTSEYYTSYFIVKLPLICTKKQQHKLFMEKFDVSLNIYWDITVEARSMICRIENPVDLDSLLVSPLAHGVRFLVSATC